MTTHPSFSGNPLRTIRSVAKCVLGAKKLSIKSLRAWLLERPRNKIYPTTQPGRGQRRLGCSRRCRMQRDHTSFFWGALRVLHKSVVCNFLFEYAELLNYESPIITGGSTDQTFPIDIGMSYSTTPNREFLHSLNVYVCGRFQGGLISSQLSYMCRRTAHLRNKQKRGIMSLTTLLQYATSIPISGNY